MKTIEDAVIALNGKIPDENEQGCFRSLCAAIYYVEGDSGIRLGSFEEFESEAKRLGYINGYRWGVEYQTNGKRPDLPDDVWVVVCDWCQQDVGAINWSEETKFKITDSKLKPADTRYLNESTQAQSLTHSEWYESGERPPVGVECEVYNHTFGKNAEWESCKILWSGNFLMVYSSDSHHECSANIGHLEFRPIRTEREKVIEAALGPVSIWNLREVKKWLEALYDVGMLVLPPKKSDTED